MASDPRTTEPDPREPEPGPGFDPGRQPDPSRDPDPDASAGPRDPGFTARESDPVAVDLPAAADEGTAPDRDSVTPAADPSSAAPPLDRDAAASTAVPAGAATDDGTVVAMRDVSRRFEDRTVLRGVNLTVPRGTILGIIGPSGAGKTTTIRMLTGALAPSEGEVMVLGHEPKRFHRAQRERIGYMPQSFTLYDDLTAGENVDFVASLFGMLFRRRRSRVRQVLHVVDLWEARGRQAGRLSGGMQRRLALACALVHEPELIILDEPTAGIDPLLRGSIWDELHRLRDAGRTLLVTTQHVSEADECDSVAMIVGGEIVALAPPNELRRMATHGDLLDIETATVFDGTDLVGMAGVGEISQDGPRHFRVVVDDAGSALPTVVEKIKSSGVEVQSAREHRLSFDEIFAILVARHKQARGADADVADGEAAA
jgi:ABC-2 type transport system ATP-binding protein